MVVVTVWKSFTAQQQFQLRQSRALILMTHRSQRNTSWMPVDWPVYSTRHSQRLQKIKQTLSLCELVIVG